MSHQTKQETYRWFREYVENDMRDNDNPELSVIDFDLMKEPGPIFLELELTGVNRVKQAGTVWSQQVKSFKRGARLEAEPGTYDTSLKYIAYIPYVDIGEKKKRNRYSDESDGKYRQERQQQGPDPFRLIMWIFAFLIVLVIAGFKVTGDEWSILSSLFISQ
jgi:hypothetical protein